MWNRDPHRAGDTGLSRYYDFGEGPPAEAVQDETGFYRKVSTYFFFHPAQADDYIPENKAGVMQPVAGGPLTLPRYEPARPNAPPARASDGELQLSSLFSHSYHSIR